MTINYSINAPVATDEFTSLLRNCSLGERRPLEDRQCLEGMIANSNLVISVRLNGELTGRLTLQ